MPFITKSSQQPLLFLFVIVACTLFYVTVKSVGNCSTLEDKVVFVSPTKETTLDTSAWCPNAQCSNSPLCRPCDRRFLLLVLATGRSASTTLTWMLDTLPGVRMAGENMGELEKIYDAIVNVRDIKNFIAHTDSRESFGHNRVPEGAYACAAQKLIETINPPPIRDGTLVYDDTETIIGFKTIRLQYFKGSYKELADFIKEMFPCAGVVVNTRSDINVQAESYSRSKNKIITNTTVERLTNQTFQIARLFGEENVRYLDSSKWIKDVSLLNEVVSWLGFNEACHFTELLQFNTKGIGFGNGLEEISLSKDCRYVGVGKK